ncbi:MAG: hypothetical protein V3U80_04385 [Flavobacteriaceae bacterium]
MKQKINIKKEVLIGVLVGFAATAMGFYFYTQVFNKYSLKFIKVLITEEKMLSDFLAYAVLPNLLAFFVFIKRKRDYRARGVMIATFIVALVLAYSVFTS